MKTLEFKLGKLRKLKLPNFALKQLEVRFGTKEEPKTYLEILNNHSFMTEEQTGVAVMAKFATTKILTDIVYCGLLHYEDETLTEDYVMNNLPEGRMITAKNLIEFLNDVYGINELDEDVKKKVSQSPERDSGK